ncbi:MAG: hypothetical protein FD162_2143 [Rhodobacteraceae bacterium]|nr:MAG: hypothetical protein FD162_2143 [Paracoccaceae bacterium]
MSILNIITGLVALGFAVFSVHMFQIATSSAQFTFAGIMLAAAGIIFAIAALILAIERRP